MSCYTTIYLEKKTIIQFTVEGDVSSFSIYFRVKENRENITAPLIEIQASSLSYVSPSTSGVFSFDLTASTLAEGIYEAEMEITDGSTFSDIIPTKIEIATSLDN